MLAFASGSSAATEQVNVALEFTAPPGCADRETFAAGLRSRSNRIQIVESGDRSLLVSVKLTPSERGVHGELWLTDARREPELRAVEGVDCAEVVEALSLTAALAIEQTVALEAPLTSNKIGGPSSQDSGHNAVNGAASASPLHPPDPMPSSHPELGPSSWRGRVHSQLLIEGVFSHRLSTQNGVGVSLAWVPRFKLAPHHLVEFGVGGIYIPESFLQPASRLRASYVGSVFQFCPYVLDWDDMFSISPCAQFEIGSLKVHDRTVDIAYPSQRAVFAGGATGRLRLRLTHRVGLVSSATLLAPFPTHRYLAEKPDVEVGRTPVATWQVNLGWMFEW